MTRAGRLTVDLRPLRIPAFRRVWLATAVTAVGGTFTAIAVPTQLFALTGSSASIGLAGVVTFVALAGAALWGGAVADVVDRRRMMLVTGTGLAVTSALFWVQAALGWRSVPVLLGLVAVQSAFFGADASAMGASIPRVVPPALIPAASSLGSIVRQAGAIVGPLLAAVLIPLVGLRTLYLLDALALTAIVRAVVLLPAIPPPPGAARWPDLRHLADGFRYLSGRPILLAVLAADLAAMVFGMPVALFPEVAARTFGDPAEGGPVLGLLFAAYPVGVLAMGLLSGTVTRRSRHGALVTLAVVAWGVTVTGFGLATGLWLALAMLVLGGAANFLLSTFRNAITQSYASDEMRGRTQGILVVVLTGGPSLSYVLHGGAAATVGPAAAIVGGGVLTVGAMVATVAAVPAFWRYRAPAGPTEVRGGPDRPAGGPEATDP